MVSSKATTSYDKVDGFGCFKEPGSKSTSLANGYF
jgi:hypothetical protein